MNAQVTTKPRERGILFKGPMVCAIVAGQKTQTRRILDFEDHGRARFYRMDEQGRAVFGDSIPDDPVPLVMSCPYGVAGDRLWVKETWRPRIAHSHGEDACDCADVTVRYDADGAEIYFDERGIPNTWTMPKAARGNGNVSPLFLPRWAARVRLEVTGVRVERLHDITEEDAKAEGVPPVRMAEYHLGIRPRSIRQPVKCTYRESFASLWDEINGKRIPWACNPFCWVINFKRIA